MDRVDLIPPPAETAAPADAAVDDAMADARAVAPLLNCLLREVAEPLPGASATDGRALYRLPGTGRLLRVRGTRRPAGPEVRSAGVWQPLGHTELVKLVAEELRRHTGLSNHELPAEMIDSRDAVAALLAARARATPPPGRYRRSEQSLVTGHPHHPAPKARGGGPVAGWLPYAPEAYAAFPPALLGVREDLVVEEGDTSALDALGAAPPGYRLLPAHPWQLDLAAPALAPAFADGRLVRLGTAGFTAWPTAAVRTLYAPGRDLFLKFSLDVRITNDVRRLWRHDLLKLRRTDAAATRAFAALDSPAAWLSDRGYRTASFAFEELAVLVRDGLDGHVLPGATPLLAAGLVEGFEGSPLGGAGPLHGAGPFDEAGPLGGAARPAGGGAAARATSGAAGRSTGGMAVRSTGGAAAGGPVGPAAGGPVDPAVWWEAYLRVVVPPVLAVFADHGVVLEAHLQNTLVAVDEDGMPVQAVFRDAEGVKLTADVERAAGWERLVYCLVVNHLTEIAAVLAERHPGFDPWPAARRELARHDLPEVRGLLAAPTLPGKTNLLLRWTGADGADARYLPLPNPLARGRDAPA
ncbi:IucA/IucC family protein [Streptomyces sp. NPDC001388]|uniref:IucA/IucC family protein n=1 Tax=unclassified Streptomyces TaxID=2593676 RepID=UPI0036C08936